MEALPPPKAPTSKETGSNANWPSHITWLQSTALFSWHRRTASAAHVKSTQTGTKAPGFLSPEEEPPRPPHVEQPETTAAIVKENRSASQQPVAASSEPPPAEQGPVRLPGWLWELIANSVCSCRRFTMAQNSHVNNSSKGPRSPRDTCKFSNGRAGPRRQRLTGRGAGGGRCPALSGEDLRGDRKDASVGAGPTRQQHTPPPASTRAPCFPLPPGAGENVHVASATDTQHSGRRWYIGVNK